MITTMNTNTMEVTAKAETKREADLLAMCKNLLYEELREGDRRELMDLENKMIELLEVAVVGTSHTFYKSPAARARFVEMVAKELLEQAETTPHHLRSRAFTSFLL